MTSEKFERMEGLSSIAATNQFIAAIKTITQDLLQEGFEDSDIREYLERVVGFVVDDVTLPM